MARQPYKARGIRKSRPAVESHSIRAARQLTARRLGAVMAVLSSATWAGPCPTSGSQIVRIVAVEPRFDLRLADGRLVRLAGLEAPQQTPSDPDLDEMARKRLATLLLGQTIRLEVLTARPDRWGRIAAFVFVDNPQTTAGGVATTLIARGDARYRADPDAHACREAYLTAEGAARATKLGVWTDPYYAILSVDDRASFAERAGTNVVAEGRLIAVQSGPYRTTLRFARPERRPNPDASRPDTARQDPEGAEPLGRGSYSGRMLVATIVPRVMKTFEAQKVDVRALIGQSLRLRGLLDTRFGPQIELTTPDEVEPLGATHVDTSSQSN